MMYDHTLAMPDMIHAQRSVTGEWFALYLNRDRHIVVARDARGFAIRCASEELAHSVAGYRRKRLEIWT